MPKKYPEMRVLLTLHKTKVKRANGTKVAENHIHIVQYGDSDPVLEKRNFFVNQEDELQLGRARGFSLNDFEFLLANTSKIIEILFEHTNHFKG